MFEKWLMCAVRVGSADQVAGVTWVNKGAGKFVQDPSVVRKKQKHVQITRGKGEASGNEINEQR